MIVIKNNNGYLRGDYEELNADLIFLFKELKYEGCPREELEKYLDVEEDNGERIDIYEPKLMEIINKFLEEGEDFEEN